MGKEKRKEELWMNLTWGAREGEREEGEDVAKEKKRKNPL